MSHDGSSHAGFLPARVIHLHPSRFCNLACIHCYSESGPYHRGGLAPEHVIAALPLLRAEGYEVLSLSGGEPLLYPGFEVLARNAATHGFRVNLVSNGAPVGGRVLDIIAEYVSLVAISLDGAPDTHVKMRGDARAFVRAERAMDRLSARGVRYGVSYCVSRESLGDMPWVVEFAASRGASLVQFHPFADVGRGRHLAERLGLTLSDKARAFVTAALLETRDGPAVQLDLAPAALARSRRADYAVLELMEARAAPLSDLVNPLVIDEMGQVLPLSYGMNPRLMLGQLSPELGNTIERYKAVGFHDLRNLLATAFDHLGADGDQFVDWFYHVVKTSYARRPGIVAA